MLLRICYASTLTKLNFQLCAKILTCQFKCGVLYKAYAIESISASNVICNIYQVYS